MCTNVHYCPNSSNLLFANYTAAAYMICLYCTYIHIHVCMCHIHVCMCICCKYCNHTITLYYRSLGKIDVKNFRCWSDMTKIETNEILLTMNKKVMFFIHWIETPRDENILPRINFTWNIQRWIFQTMVTDCVSIMHVCTYVCVIPSCGIVLVCMWYNLCTDEIKKIRIKIVWFYINIL